jgi:hypothetical protein
MPVSFLVLSLTNCAYADPSSADLEPRRDGLSTIEAAAMLLANLERRPDLAATLHGSFKRMLAKYREAQSVPPELAPKPKPKRDYRRRKRA